MNAKPIHASADDARDAAIADAVRLLRHRFADLDGILDLTRTRSALLESRQVHAAKGFLVKVPANGRLFAIKPEALREWVTGSLSLRSVLKAMERRGWLVRGCDDKATRQVVIPGLGRQRYFCFKLQAAAHRRLIDAEPAIEIPRRPTSERIANRIERQPMRRTWTDDEEAEGQYR